ncbi:hypothetical protein [Tropicibacter naphthalenivorans]|uniref:Uncharacterized protein n=1 Tax=Tropicibacter naphthalenivorans TaxID=441103 RepID=A0A0P1G382_9RHOB|nr:hypothetical protein [Tropicibacter naphthalenivorans]CUH76274.1 hypothetical protein TRN7648_00866 [Tropicibacter naphthalenivorans]SMC39056.1 hypothetical protein SAMN04488093_10116 [Tropicibacter naphthalenivorans]
MAQPRKRKPGPKRRTGRPATAATRAKNTAYQKAQREALQEVGYVVMQIVVPQEESAHLRRKSQVHRIEGLIAAAMANEDLSEARRQEYRLAALRIEHEAEIRAENSLKNRLEREEQAQIEAWRKERAAAVEDTLQTAKPSWMV